LSARIIAEGRRVAEVHKFTTPCVSQVAIRA
jgi:hypothetical protein